MHDLLWLIFYNKISMFIMSLTTKIQISNIVNETLNLVLKRIIENSINRLKDWKIKRN
jgi:hypothetical protein